MEIRTVRTRGDLNEWVRFPCLALYPLESPWVPPLDSDLRRMLDRRKNPFFQHGEAEAYLAVNQGRVVGRILAHVSHRHNVRHGEKTCFFGYFECQNDPAAAQALFAAARAFAERQGCERLRGPFNMTPMQEMGILVDGFDQAPPLDLVYTPPYYPALLEAAGLRGVFTAATYRVPVAPVDPDRMLGERHRTWLASGRLRIRHAQMRAYAKEMELFRELINDSMYDNQHFTPLTAAEMAFQVEPFKLVMDPKLCLIAELDGVPVAYIMCAPDFNPVLKRLNGSLNLRGLWTFWRSRKLVRDAILIIAGAQRHLQNQGIARILLAELFRTLQQGGYDNLSITWVGEANDKSLASIVAVGGYVLQRLQLFESPCKVGA